MFSVFSSAYKIKYLINILTYVIAAIHEKINRSQQIFPCMLTVFPDFGSFLTPKALTFFSAVHDFRQFFNVTQVFFVSREDCQIIEYPSWLVIMCTLIFADSITKD